MSPRTIRLIIGMIIIATGLFSLAMIGSFFRPVCDTKPSQPLSCGFARMKLHYAPLIGGVLLTQYAAANRRPVYPRQPRL